MLTEELKTEIQEAYRSFLKGKQLKARYGQRIMMAEIANSLANIEYGLEGERTSGEPVCVLEAGTGTGKTVAYLLAVLPIAASLDKTVVISTATVNLQEQILYKDIPELIKHSGLNISVKLAKGRSRYLCSAKIKKILQQEDDVTQVLALYEDELSLKPNNAEVEIYRQMDNAYEAQEWCGDKDEWSSLIDDQAWQRVTATHLECSGRRCPYVDQCSFFTARNALNDADCIVANHDLVLSDLALGGGAILPAPMDTIYIFDEGHHLPEKARKHFSAEFRFYSSVRWYKQIEKTLAQMASALKLTEKMSKQLQLIQKQLPTLLSQFSELQQWLEDTEFSDDLSGLDKRGANEYGRRNYHLTPRPEYNRFSQGLVPDELSLLAANIRASLLVFMPPMEYIVDTLKEALNDRDVMISRHLAEIWHPVMALMLSRVDANFQLWSFYSYSDKEGQLPLARWIESAEVAGNPELSVCCSPILAADVLQQNLWQKCYGVVITSATLTALGSFDRFLMNTGVSEQSTLKQIPGSFDYQQAGLLMVPAEARDPSDTEAHTHSIVTYISSKLDLGGASLVLFSSRKQMEDVYELLEEEIKCQVLKQGDRSRMELIKQHKEAIDNKQGSILFGLASFAEGVDLPGAYLEHVVIAKIPFSVPDDPVEAALAEWVKQTGGNPFWKITVADASTKLIQASGRLIRSESDHGQITLLDSRVASKSYGKALLNALPPYKRQIEWKP